MPKMLIIINPDAGSSSDASKRAIEEELSKWNLRAELAFLTSSDSIRNRVKEAKSDGVEVVVAAGGDGTVNVVASHLAHSEVKLGVLPMGTLNHFARDLRIPNELPKAVRVLGEGY